VRNALTKLSHVHFTSTEKARARVISMGEAEWRVHRAGAPSLDHLRRSPLLPPVPGQPAVIVAYHPTTIARDTLREAEALFTALASVEGPLFFCYPNADAGSRALITRAKEFLDRRGNGQVLVNLDPVAYWSLLRDAKFLLGNSSSGIMEAASFGIPAVNVGIRQRGREHGSNVLDADATVDSILARVAQATDPAFRASLTGMENPYGDGHAAERIAAVLASVPLGEELLIKR
jgi:UDP-N-acetylglucosamine 2-epimerase (non-hydrolysing)/GDP/UDP-N,N'-diacetylbacillosamine 2-epimerase (hydrolysing)